MKSTENRDILLLSLHVHEPKLTDVYGRRFWAQMNRDIEEVVSRSGMSQMYRDSQQKEPMVLHEQLTVPWDRGRTDM